MISSYPKESKNMIFTHDAEVLDKVMKDIIAIRNLKANNNIPKEALVKFDVEEGLSKIYTQQLKIQDSSIVSSCQAQAQAQADFLTVNYSSSFINITYYYKGQEVDTAKVQAEIESLKKSIERRKNLLANESYVNKAPKNIVDMDRKKLEEEVEKLNKLMQ